MRYFSPKLEDPNYISNGFPNHIFLSRTYTVSKQYKKYKKTLDDNNISEHDQIKHFLSDPNNLIANINNNIYISKNIFPYKKPLGVEQYLLWIFDTNLDNINHLNVYNIMQTHNIIKPDSEYIIWINKPKQRSIKTIKHFHILVRPNINLTKSNLTKSNLTKSNLTNPKLKQLIIIARHGPREPITYLPNLKPFDNIDYYNPKAKLTNQGREYCKNFGSYMKLFYNQFNISNIKTQYYSSNYSRTIESAQYFSIGFFKNYVPNITITDDLAGVLKLKHNAKPDFFNYHNNIILETQSDTMDQMIYDLFGYKITNIRDYFDIESTLDVYRFHNLNIIDNLVNNNSINNLTKSDLEKLDLYLKEISAEYYYKLFYQTKFTNAFTDPVLNLIKQIISNPEINFAYLSTHDVVLYPLILRLAKEQIKIPQYCSNLRFEIYDDEILAYYDDLLILHIVK